MRYFFIILFFALLGCSDSEGIVIIEGYKPSKPIKFSHSLHIEKGIDCRYCHNSTDESNKSDLPSVNVCKNCHDEKKKAKAKTEKEIEEKLPTQTNKTSRPDDSHCLYDIKKHTGPNAEEIPDDWECAKCHY